MNKECNTSEAFRLERLLKGNENYKEKGFELDKCNIFKPSSERTG